MGSYDPEMDGYVPPEISLRSLTIGEKIGEGSFSEVYRGVVRGEDGSCENVIAKAYKKNVRGRDWFSFYADERATCRRLAETNCAGVAPFLGVCGSDAYLVWKDVGVVTLETCLEDAADAEAAFAALADAFGGARDRRERGDAGEDGDRATPAAAKARAELFLRLAKSLLEAVCELHANEVVHRDVKPENVLLTDSANGAAPRALLVDLGGAADFVNAVNVDPSETIFDPTYGAPEQFTRDDSRRGADAIPIARANPIADALAKLGVPGLGGVGSDRAAGLSASGAAPTPGLDAFALGLTLLRVATPALYSADAMARARRAMDATADRLGAPAGTELRGPSSVLDAWASGPGGESCDFALLDAAQARSLVDGLATWNPDTRLTPREALDHPCFDALK